MAKKDDDFVQVAGESDIVRGRQGASASGFLFGEVRTFTSNLRTRRRAAEARLNVREANVDLARREQLSARAARRRAATMRATGQAAAAGLRAGAAATASSRLLAEFEAGKAQRGALQRRQQEKAVGRAEAQFGAAGVQSIGAQLEAQRTATLQGNIQASQEAARKEQILGAGRQAITSAFATGVSAQAGLAAASQFGELFKREVSRDTGIDVGFVDVKGPF